MAVLKPENFSDFLNKLSKATDDNFIKDSKVTATFAEIARQAILKSKEIYKSSGTGKTFFIRADHSCFFVYALLTVINSGNIAIPVSMALSQEQLKKLAVNFQADFIINDVFPVFFSKSAGLSADNTTNKSAIGLLTSGSTGDPKIVILSPENIFANAVSVIKSMGLENPGKVAVILPLYHSFALVTQLITTLLSGGQIFMGPDFSFPGELINFIRKNNIETIAGVPTTFRILLMSNEISFDNVKHITVAGAALDPLFSENIKAAFPNSRLWVGYGLTEAGPRVTAINDSENTFYSGSVGRPIDQVKIKIKDDEILVSGPSVMEGYHQDPTGTSQKIVDQWLYTGDLGIIDQDGFLYITGRKDDVFNCGGKKISPVFIEKVLNQYPGVHFSAVYGEPDLILGNKIIALIQPEPDSTVTSHELFIHCQKNLEKFLVPHKFMKINNVPLTPNGKLLRKELALCRKEKL